MRIPPVVSGNESWVKDGWIDEPEVGRVGGRMINKVVDHCEVKSPSQRSHEFVVQTFGRSEWLADCCERGRQEEEYVYVEMCK